jgi:hypothetical protein
MDCMSNSAEKTVKSIVLAGIAIIAACLFGGCSFNGAPRVRLGSYATATPGTRFLDINNLGKHSYCGSPSENDGIVYTCRGGHIDINHVRIAADYVRYLYNKTKKNLMKGKSEFTFGLNVDRSTYFVKLTYPADWKTFSKQEKEKIADEVSLKLSRYFTYTMVTWHEILTWFGFKTMGVLPEFPSAFSWEDNYSNLVGTRVGAQALQDKQHDYDEAMTIALKKELENLGVQPRKTAREASLKMKGKWWNGTLLIDMRQRNMDIGLVDGNVTPTLVLGVCEGAKPQSYPAPALKALSKYGFAMSLEIKPKEWESRKILKIVYPDGKAKKIQPMTDIPVVMEYIKKEALKMGYNVMPPGKNKGSKE